MTSLKKVKIFDTTLRDGEQSPGASMTKAEKLIIAKQLARLNVDVIEAGFAISSNEDYEAIKEIAKEIKGPIICSLARLVKEDIDRAWDALKYSSNPRIHVFIATSKIHLEKKLKMSNVEIIAKIKEMVSYAKSLCKDIEFSPEDASRSDFEFMIEAIKEAILAGATTINIPDTVGYSQPEEFANRVKEVFEALKELIDDKGVTISVHCHNDLGNAVANSLMAVKNGASQVEGCINGIGERAGNSALEEVIMNLKTRQDYYEALTGINLKELFNTSMLVSKITGLDIQRNKAVVGKNAFSHEAGIHQHGVLADKSTYEIMNKEEIGWVGSGLVIGKHSGKHAIKALLKSKGYDFTDQLIDEVVKKSKELADYEKEIIEEDIIALANDLISENNDKEAIVLKDVRIEIASGSKACAELTVDYKGAHKILNSKGIGPVDASIKALETLLEHPVMLKDYGLKAVTRGSDALAQVSIILEYDNKSFKARAVDKDIVMASILAIIKGMNNALK